MVSGSDGGGVNWDRHTGGGRRGPEAFSVPDGPCAHPLLALGLHGCLGGFVSKLGDAELGEINETSPISVGQLQSQSEEPLLLRNGKQVVVTHVWKT